MRVCQVTLLSIEVIGLGPIGVFADRWTHIPHFITLLWMLYASIWSCIIIKHTAGIVLSFVRLSMVMVYLIV